MSAATYMTRNNEEVFKRCTNQCGIIAASADQQFFSIDCIQCSDKFLNLELFIGHLQTKHAPPNSLTEQPPILIKKEPETHDNGDFYSRESPQQKVVQLSDMDLPKHVKTKPMEHLKTILTQRVYVPVKNTESEQAELQLDMIKEEPEINDNVADEFLITELQDVDEFQSTHVKNEPVDFDLDMQDINENASYNHYSACAGEQNGNDEEEGEGEVCNMNEDDLDEESLHGLSDGDFKLHSNAKGAKKYLKSQDKTNLTVHIKDRKMIKFLIDSYRSNPFLWDPQHPDFRGRIKRYKFLDWFVDEFKRRFNVCLVKDAIARKWHSLRMVYKRECSRMAQKKIKVSTLWYFKELEFLNSLNDTEEEPETMQNICRRHHSVLKTDVVTNALLSLMQQHPCFYDKFHIDYRSKERRGEALEIIAEEINVTAIQISKRISQLCVDYSQQKKERLLCERIKRVFVPNFIYYDKMQFMDAVISPFKCDFCPLLLETHSELEAHENRAHIATNS